MLKRVLVLLLASGLFLPLLTPRTRAQLNNSPTRQATTNAELVASSDSGPAHIPAPEDILGFVPGDDRKLASWSQVVEYFEKLDKASDRVKFETLGKSTMGRPFVMATISAPENLARLDEYRRFRINWRTRASSEPCALARARSQSGGTDQARQDDRADHLRDSFHRGGLLSFEHAHRSSAGFVGRARKFKASCATRSSCWCRR